MKRTYNAPGIKIIAVHLRPIMTLSNDSNGGVNVSETTINANQALTKDKGIWDNDHSWNPTWGNEK